MPTAKLADSTGYIVNKVEHVRGEEGVQLGPSLKLFWWGEARAMYRENRAGASYRDAELVVDNLSGPAWEQIITEPQDINKRVHINSQIGGCWRWHIGPDIPPRRDMVPGIPTPRRDKAYQPPPPCGQTNTSENIAFPQLSLRSVNKTLYLLFKVYLHVTFLSHVQYSFHPHQNNPQNGSATHSVLYSQGYHWYNAKI